MEKEEQIQICPQFLVANRNNVGTNPILQRQGFLLTNKTLKKVLKTKMQILLKSCIEFEVQEFLVNVEKIYKNNYSFAAKIRDTGKIITWGYAECGGDSTEIENQLVNIKTVISTNGTFTAIKNDGTKITWGKNFQRQNFVE